MRTEEKEKKERRRRRHEKAEEEEGNRGKVGNKSSHMVSEGGIDRDARKVSCSHLKDVLNA